MFAKLSLCFGIASVLAAYGYYRYHQQSNEEHDLRNNLGREERIAIELITVMGNGPAVYRKVAVGTNANVDLIVSGVALLRQLNVSEIGVGLECSEVTSLQELEQCFSYFMAKGAAAERQITSKELNTEIINAATSLNDVQQFVGGNAALVGLKLAELLPSTQVMLCGPVGPQLQSLLSDAVFVPDSCRMPTDEHHLILEYQKNEQWAKNRAPIASRFIMSHDVSNSALASLEAFIEETLAFKPDLVVVSGFHLLDGKSGQFWFERLSAAARAFAGLPRSIPVHLELASMSECDVMREIVTKIFPLVDSIGLNEQELVFISRCLNGIHSDISEVDKRDEIGYYSDMATWILQTYGTNGKQGGKGSRLSRVHFHCLYVHIVAALPNHWDWSEASVAAGSWAAYSQACETKVASSSQSELRIPSEFRLTLSSSQMTLFDLAKPLVSYSRDNIYLFLAPVIVCKRPVKTVGLGDAISASGLLYTKFRL